ncbi:NAD(P)-dependent oxidoreductase [Halomonas organivorans]|uniref:NAD(P)-binding domain-containing protein n=1 Tax=Halomonas organivorans TaxID=257772 RepID=A0A7W5G3Z1_9GAMM|nr:NAD(P)-dependent oxidoreductase [Halomonas organivorans]MBB3139863.1 hypothetical protein [Halomonas organivorans]
MKIALIGASGFIGTALLNEALERGHTITALVTRPERLPSHDRLAVVRADVLDIHQTSRQLHGHEAVISAFSGHAQSDVQGYYERGARTILEAVKAAEIPRLLMVGGAGALEVAPGKQLLDTPTFPDQIRPTAEGARSSLTMLRDEPELDWCMLAPSAKIAPGRRTGNFRLDNDRLLVDSNGDSHISVEDYAVAMMDELEQPAHSRQRFTVGY